MVKVNILLTIMLKYMKVIGTIISLTVMPNNTLILALNMKVISQMV